MFKWFLNLRISIKLIAAFMVIAVIAGLVGTFGVFALTKQKTQNEDLFENYGNSQGYLGNILGEFHKQRTLCAFMVLEQNEDSTKTYIGQIEESDKIIEEYLTAYKKACTKDDEINEYDNLKKSIESYNNFKATIIGACKNSNYLSAKTSLISSSANNTAVITSDFLETTVQANVERAHINMNEQSSSVAQTIIIMVGAAAFAVIIALVLGIIIARVISRPIKQVSAAAEKLASGDTNIDITFKRNDEIGKLGRAFENMVCAIRGLIDDSYLLVDAAVDGRLSVRADQNKHKGDYKKIIEGFNKTLDAVIAPIEEASQVLSEISNGNLNCSVIGSFNGDHALIKEYINKTVSTLNRYIQEISEILCGMADGNFNAEITSDYKGDFIALKDAINTIVRSLNDTIMEINLSADQVALGTRHLSEGSQRISQGSIIQASSLEQLTASISQVTVQTHQNAENAVEANELSAEAKLATKEGSSQIAGMQQAMTDIIVSSKNISRIIKVIDGIAFQTNILALNAAVEAARAGIHGKGFAVVAEEVRNLAVKSAEATKETTILIEESIKKINDGTRIADQTANALVTILEGVDKITDIVSGITDASNEQAVAISQINKGIEQLSQVVQTNSAIAQEAAASSEQLWSQADMLKEMVSRFNFITQDEHNKLPESENDAQENGRIEEENNLLLDSAH